MIDITTADDVRVTDTRIIEIYGLSREEREEVDLFHAMFGRRPDAADHRLGVRRLVELQRDLIAFHGSRGRDS